MTEKTEINDNKLISDFFQSVQALRDADIIRSGTYLGDIGEFLAVRTYSVDLLESQNAATIDGYIDGRSVQIKFNGSPQGENIYVGMAEQYDILILILAHTSKHFPDGCHAEIIAYRIETDRVQDAFYGSEDGKYYCTKNSLSGFDYLELNMSE